jgi:hypothetical protein
MISTAVTCGFQILPKNSRLIPATGRHPHAFVEEKLLLHLLA